MREKKGHYAKLSKSEVKDYALPIMYGYIGGFEHGLVTGLVRYIRELQNRGLIPKEGSEKAIKAVLHDYGYAPLSCVQVAEKIGELYKDGSNDGIPFLYVIPLICKKARGAITEEQMEIELRGLRQEYQTKSEATH